MNRKGIAPIMIVLAIIGFFLIVYIILLLPIPALEKIRWTINYVFVIIMFFAVQAVFFYLYFKFSVVIYKTFIWIKAKMENVTHSYKKLIHS